jgi:hypothetical protein
VYCVAWRPGLGRNSSKVSILYSLKILWLFSDCFYWLGLASVSKNKSTKYNSTKSTKDKSTKIQKYKSTKVQQKSVVSWKRDAHYKVDVYFTIPMRGKNRPGFKNAERKPILLLVDVIKTTRFNYVSIEPTWPDDILRFFGACIFFLLCLLHASKMKQIHMERTM